MRVTATAEFMLEPILEPNKDAGSSRDAIGLGQRTGIDQSISITVGKRTSAVGCKKLYSRTARQVAGRVA